MDKDEMIARLYGRLYSLAWRGGYFSRFADFKTDGRITFLIETLILLRLWEGKGEHIYRTAYEKGRHGKHLTDYMDIDWGDEVP